MKTAAILVGGRGTRLGNLVAEIPKPMLNIAGYPFLDYLLTFLSLGEFENIYLLAGYKSDLVFKRYNKKIIGNSVISVIKEDEELGTGGAIANLRPFVNNPFLLVNGDSILKFNLDEFIRIPDCSVDWTLKIAARWTDAGGRYGTIETEPDGTVISFAEKSEIKSGFVNAGYYLFTPSIFGFLNNRHLSLELDLIPRLVGLRGVRAQNLQGYFIDIGVPHDYARAQVEIPSEFQVSNMFQCRGEDD